MARQEFTKIEKIRARREKQTRGNVQSSRSKSQGASRRSPQVMVRGGRGQAMGRMQKRYSPRRRFDVALSSPGVEIRFPAVPAIQNYWQIFSGVLTIILAILLIIVWNSPEFEVTQVEVQGFERFTTQEISRAINVIGKPAFSLIPALLQEDLENTYPGLADVDVRVDWPASVVITIEERQPVLAWNREGTVRWVDANGSAFEPRGMSEEAVRVLAFSPPPESAGGFTSPEFVNSIALFAEYVPEGVPVCYDAAHGLGWQDERGWQVYFGFDTSELAVKQMVYQAIVKRLEQKNIRPALISVEYVDSPYYRMER
ncbi:MAG: hypothetical protein DRI56_05105 [Chloroflexota bacterium]|nr:MAG: hypothetical protein DRI56_05105 [Chloroflexota bacterium]